MRDGSAWGELTQGQRLSLSKPSKLRRFNLPAPTLSCETAAGRRGAAFWQPWPRRRPELLQDQCGGSLDDSTCQALSVLSDPKLS